MRLLQHILIAGCALVASVVGAQAQEHIGSTALARNDVTRESAGASAPLVTGDSVFRNETVRTGADSNARLVFLDSTNLGVGPTSSVKLDQFVYVGESNGQKMTVNLAKGVFRFTTGVLDKKAYEITTPTAAIGVRGTVLDIAVQGPDTRVTLVEGQALVCPRRPGVSFAQQERNCTKAAGGIAGAHCDCVELKNVGQTAQVKKTGSASLTSNAVNYAFNDGGFASGVLCGR
ncbi:MAG: FecR domain-containing protein [Roseiarcus sp.]|uniref:FecR family protein n=1 Tax=Roseiarcus sp. TaxID=1969460 RepID=UPI003C51DB37